MDDLLKQIYGPNVGQAGRLPYRVFSDGKGESYGLTKVEHWPGAKGQTSETMPTDLKLWGFVGVTVEDYKRPIAEQNVRICWTGIDIDAEDNGPAWDVERAAYKVYDLIPKAIIRTSKSGNGLHVILPWGIDGYPRPWSQAKMEAKHDTAVHVKRLIDADIVPCVFGLVNMWLFSEGGKQRTLWPA